MNKNNSVIYYRNLQQCLEKGLIKGVQNIEIQTKRLDETLY